jgi:hypothetical protein
VQKTDWLLKVLLALLVLGVWGLLISPSYRVFRRAPKRGGSIRHGSPMTLLQFVSSDARKLNSEACATSLAVGGTKRGLRLWNAHVAAHKI